MISLRKSGSIGINNAALEKFIEDGEEYIEIYYDEEDNQIGLKPLESETEDSYTLSLSESGGAVAPTSFLKRQNLIPEVTTQYEPRLRNLNENTEIIVIKLDEPKATYGEPDTETEEENQDET